MKAVVVYESLWGNTAQIAKAIADGIGPDAKVMSTAEASGADVAEADLLVAGAPLQAFSLPTERTRASIDPAKQDVPPDLSGPTLRSWLASVPTGHGRSAAFETKIRWSPGSAVGTIEHELDRAGYTPIANGQKFYVAGTTGPLRDGEVERARRWGQQLRQAIG